MKQNLNSENSSMKTEMEKSRNYSEQFHITVLNTFSFLQILVPLLDCTYGIDQMHAMSYGYLEHTSPEGETTIITLPGIRQEFQIFSSFGKGYARFDYQGPPLPLVPPRFGALTWVAGGAPPLF